MPTDTFLTFSIYADSCVHYTLGGLLYIVRITYD